MRILAARFPRPEAAWALLAELQDRYALGAGDARVGLLGSTDYGRHRDAEGLLAGRFRPERVPEIADLIATFGGEIVLDADEAHAGTRSS